MKRRRDRPRRQRNVSAAPGRREWIAGILVPPFYLLDREEPYRPRVVVWLELPEGRVVGRAMVLPEDLDGAVGRVLCKALTAPLVGPPRRPDAIRVDDPLSADEVRAEIGGTIPVTVAPIPEMDDVLKHMVESMPPSDTEESYFADGRVSPAAIERLFTAARGLFATAPWSIAADTQVLRMDVPALDVEGACLSILGQATGRHGVLIFPSLIDFEVFMAAAGDLEDGPIDLGSGWLALMYERAADLPPSMRREAMKHGWPVAGPDAYPVVERRDPDGVPRPLVERDVAIVAACARSLGTFIRKHAAMFSSDTFTPTCESYFDVEDLEVRFSVPHEGDSDFDPSDPLDDADADLEFDVALDPEPPATAPAPFRPRVARNAPCPCGSGRKYKKCCLPVQEAAHAERQPTQPVHESDERLVARLTRFAMREFGDAWTAFANDFDRLLGAVSLAAPWSVYNFEVDGRTAAGAYLDRHGHRCTPDGTRLDERTARRLAVGLGGPRGRSGQDGDAARSAVRRAADRAGETRLAEPGFPRRGACPHRRPRGDIAPLRNAPACPATVRRRQGRTVRQGPTAALAGSRPPRPPAGPGFRQLPDSALGGSRECRRRPERPAAPVL